MPSKFFLISVLFMGIAVVIQAQTLRILTEEDPPYNFMEDEGPTGYAVQVVQEIQKRLGTREPMEFVPWARGYQTILTSPNVVLFTMARTKDRRNLFQWVGPITENRWVAVAPRSSNLQLRSLEDLKKLKALGVVREFASAQFLQEQKFTNLQLTVKNEQNVLKCREGRIEAFISSDNTWQSEVLAAGIDPGEFKEVFQITTLQLYIAHSRTTSQDVVQRWNQVLEDMKKDGTLLWLIRRWLPGRTLPGPEKEPPV